MNLKRKFSALVLGLLIFSVGTFAKTIDAGAWGEGSTVTDEPIGRIYFPNASNGDYSYGYFKDNESVNINYSNYGYNNQYVFRKFKEIASGFWYVYYSPLSQDATINLSGISTSRYISQMGDMIENKYDTGYSYQYGTKNTFYSTSGNGVNFKKYGTAVNDMSSSNAKSGTMTNASYGNDLSPHFAGKTGEWRYIGYSSTGLALSNPLFPADYFITSSIIDYPWENSPWTKGMSVVSNDSPYDDRYNSSGTLITIDSYRNAKLLSINKLLEYYPGLTAKGNAEYWRNKLSLRSNPYIESPNFIGTYYDYGMGRRFYREVVAPSIIDAQSDLELKSISIIEVETNKVVASVNRGQAPQIFDKVVPGYAYKVVSTVKNVGTVKTKLPQVMTNVGYAIDNNTTNNTESNGFSNNNEKFIASKTGLLSPNEETTVEYIVKVPTNYSSSKQVTAYLTNKTNIFPDTYPYSDSDGYKANLSKDGESYVIGGTNVTASTITVTDSRTVIIKDITNKTEVDKAKASFPNSIYYSKYGYTGSLSKLGEPLVDVNTGNVTDPVSKEVTEVSKVTSSDANYSFPNTMTYLKDGYAGVLNKFGESTKVVISGSEKEVIDSKVVSKTIETTINNFPDTFPYNEGGYEGDLTKDGEVITTTTPKVESKVVDKTLEDENQYNLPETIPYNEDGATGTLYALGPIKFKVVVLEPAQSKTYSTWLYSNYPSTLTNIYYVSTDDGYSGNLNYSSLILSTTSNEKLLTGCDYKRQYSGTVNKAEKKGTIYYRDYRGTVSIPVMKEYTVYKTVDYNYPNNIPSSITVVENGVTVTLNAIGPTIPIIVSGSSDEIIDSKKVTASQTSTTNSFTDTYSYNDGVYKGEIPKSGSVIVKTEIPKEIKPINKTYTATTSSSLGATKSYTENGQTITLNATGSAVKKTIGSPADTKEIIIWVYSNDELELTTYVPYTDDEGYSAPDDLGAISNILPTNADEQYTNNCTFKRQYRGYVQKPNTVATVYSRDYYGELSVPKNIKTTVNKTYTSNNSRNLPDKMDYVDANGIAVILTATGDITSKVTSGSAPLSKIYTFTKYSNDEYDLGYSTYVVDGSYKGYISYSSDIQPTTMYEYMDTGCQYKREYSGPIYTPDTRVYSYTRSYTGIYDVPAPKTTTYTQNYAGTVNKYADTRVYIYQQAYSGSYTLQEMETKYSQKYTGRVYKYADTRIYEHSQTYKGTVTKPSVDTRDYIMIQQYIGDVTRPGGSDDREYRQNYSGTVSKGDSGSVKNSFMFTSVINDLHKVFGDNREGSNDALGITLGVNTGNIVYTGTEIVNKSGVVTENIIPGEEYKLRYKYTYQGPELKEWKTVKTNYNYVCGKYTSQSTCSAFNDTGSYSRPEVLGKLKASITRYHTGTSSQTNQFTYSDISSWKKVKDGTVFTFESPYMMFEVPYLSTDAVFDPSSSQQRNTSIGYSNVGIYSHLNNATSDDRGGKSRADSYDIKVTNARLISNNEKPVDMENKYTVINAILKYDIEMSVPSYVTDYNKDVDVNVVVGNANVKEVKHIKVGKNIGLSTPVQLVVPIGSTMRIDGAVGVNLDGYVWEYNSGADMSLNNTSNTVGTDTFLAINPPYNPSVIKDKVFPSNNIWSISYTELMTEGLKTSYSLFYKDNSLNSSVKSFYNFKTKSETVETVTNFEGVVIDKVMFRSKLTTDLKKGVNKDGWIDLMNEEGLIKAGYGYEMQIFVRYASNTLSQQPNRVAVDGSTIGSRVEVPTINTNYNFYKDIYLDTGDNQIYSGSGIYNTKKAFNSEIITQNDNEMYIKYTITGNNTFGIKTTSKIFVGENTKDGLYQLKIFTPAITGNPSGVKNEMVATKIVNIRVQGSMLDDVNTHITQ